MKTSVSESDEMEIHTVLELAHWSAVPRSCGQDVPGVGRHNPRVMDLSQRATTEDQQRIEDALQQVLSSNQRLLHVGVGNSSLAARFASRVRQIVGTTLSEAEHRHALSLPIENYRVEMLNKYAPEMASLDGHFDVLVDNNPASFCCCLDHFETMLTSYAQLIRPGGIMVTDREGMYWCYDNGPMRLRFEDLQTIARCYPFAAEQMTSHVFALRRLAA